MNIESFEISFEKSGIVKKKTMNKYLETILEKEKEYEYKHDKNFDFDNRDVNLPKLNVLLSQRISARLYDIEFGDQFNQFANEGQIQSPENLNTAARETCFLDISDDISDDCDLVLPSLHLNLRQTSHADSDISTSSMRKAPSHKLREVCIKYKYKLGLKDIREKKISIGKGAFGDVFAVNCKLNCSIYALKRMNKTLVLESGFDRIAMREKEIMNRLKHPNIVRLDAYFHDSNY